MKEKAILKDERVLFHLFNPNLKRLAWNAEASWPPRVPTHRNCPGSTVERRFVDDVQVDGNDACWSPRSMKLTEWQLGMLCQALTMFLVAQRDTDWLQQDG